MKRTSFHAENPKNSHHEITKYTGCWTFSSIFRLYSKGVQPSWYPYVALTKTARGLGSLGGKFWEQFPGRRKLPCWCPSCLLLDGAEPGTQVDPGSAGAHWLQPPSVWSRAFRLAVIPASKPLYQIRSIALAQDLGFTAHKS